MKLACESIDRVLTTEIRLPFLTRGIIPAEYEAARAKIGEPISYAMASAILKCLEEGKNRVAVFTGVYHPENFPNGESDGPLGAAVVGNAIEKLGGDVTYCLEKETIPGTVHILQVNAPQARFLPGLCWQARLMKSIPLLKRPTPMLRQSLTQRTLRSSVLRHSQCRLCSAPAKPLRLSMT